MEEFFDRERWHDVEGEEKPDENGLPEHVLVPTSHSLVILLLVAITVGSLGIAFVFLFNNLIGWTSPIPAPQDYRSISQEWFGYSLEHVVFCDTNRPVCFAAAMDGTIVVGEKQPPSLHLFAFNGGHQQLIPLDSPPLCLVTGNDDTLFPNEILVVCEQELSVYTMDGIKQFSRQLPVSDADIRSVALSDQFIFVADSKHRVVYRLDENGQMRGAIGKSGHLESGRKMSPTGPPDRKPSENDAKNEFQGFVVLRSPISLTVSPKTGLLYVTNPGKHRIEAFTQQGHWEPSLCWGVESSDVTGFTGCCNPVSIIALKDGKIATVEKSINRVKVYLPNGTLDCVVAGPEMLDVKPNNIPQLGTMPFRTVDENNGTPISIAVVERDAVLIFDPVFRVVRYLSRTDQQNSNQ